MKHILTIISFSFICLLAKAQGTERQEQDPVVNLRASLVNNNLELTWGTATVEMDNYWEVQGSVDGKSFSTIGVVLGADPKTKGNSFSFKQGNNKIKPGLKYYRVLRVENETSATASTLVSLSK